MVKEKRGEERRGGRNKFPSNLISTFQKMNLYQFRVNSNRSMFSVIQGLLLPFSLGLGNILGTLQIIEASVHDGNHRSPYTQPAQPWACSPVGISGTLMLYTWGFSHEPSQDTLLPLTPTFRIQVPSSFSVTWEIFARGWPSFSLGPQDSLGSLECSCIGYATISVLTTPGWLEDLC